MLYMIGKIILYGVSFDIVYNESVHENMKKIENTFFSRVQNKISNRDKGMLKSTVPSYTHISIK